MTGCCPICSARARASSRSGSIQPDGSFRAAEVLAKHDENYMPREVVDALKKSGHWNPAAGAPPPASTWDTLRVQKADATGRAGG